MLLSVRRKAYSGTAGVTFESGCWEHIRGAAFLEAEALCLRALKHLIRVDWAALPLRCLRAVAWQLRWVERAVVSGSLSQKSVLGLQSLLTVTIFCNRTPRNGWLV